jgi:hypothetical protein
MIRNLVSLLILSGSMGIISCDFDYQSALGSRTSGTYIATAVTHNVTGKTIDLDTNNIKQFLVFDSDTTKIIRNDTIIEQLIDLQKRNYIGRRKYGKTIFEGLTSQGRKVVMIEFENFRTMGPENLILGTIMKEPYNEKLDTLKTYYRPYQ